MSRFVKGEPASTGDVADLALLDGQAAAGTDGVAAPEWFTRALADTPSPVDVDRGGRTVRAYTWGPPAATTVVLVHGMGANAHWWDHVAPLLRQPGRQLVTVDLAGHGHSGHSADYTMRGWAEDVMAVCAALAVERPVLVGHSAGGRVAFTAMLRSSAGVRGLVVIDSALVRGTSRLARAGRGRTPGSELRVYADLEEIIARFRTLPPQRLVLPYIERYIAEQSIQEVPGGWRWLHDPGLYNRSPSPDEMPERLDCPLVYLRCENGSVDPIIGPLLRDRLHGDLPYFELPDSGHHAMLDHPLALVAMLRVILHDVIAREDPADV